MKKDGIVILSEYIDSLRKLSNEELGQLMMAVLDNAAGEEPNLDDASLTVEILYPIFQASIDRIRETSEQKAEAGRQGGRPKKQCFSEEKTSAFENEKAEVFKNEKPKPNHTIPNHTNISPNGDKEKAPTGPKRKAEPFQELFADAPELNQDFVCEAWEAWLEVRRRKKVPWTADAAILNAKNLKKLSRGDPIRAVKILEQSTEQGWQGLFELKSQGKNGKIDWEAI